MVSRFLTETGFTVEQFSPSKGPPVIFAELASKTGRRTLVFYNHYDVQPVEPVELWKNPPFSATVEDGRIYARGASDNKGNIVSRLMAINAFLKARGDVPCNIKWAIEGEEEIGSPHFSEFITRYKDRRTGESAIWEFGGLDYDSPKNGKSPTDRVGHEMTVTRSYDTGLQGSAERPSEAVFRRLGLVFPLKSLAETCPGFP